MARLIAALLAVMLAAPGAALAQSVTAPAERDGVLHRAAAREAVRMAHNLRADTQAAQPAKRGGHPILIGAAIGAAGMFLFTRSGCGWHYGEGVCTTVGDVLMTGAGAGMGAAAGAIIGALRR